MHERRYGDDEVREILALATEVTSTEPSRPVPAAPSAAHGLTLQQLQDVAAEAGIAPDRITVAARSLDALRSSRDPGERHFGVEIDATHTVALPRMMTDDEWDRFVVRLRDTFGAPGEVRKEGSLRTWTQGFQKVLLEPLAEGARLRFEGRHHSAKSSVDAGVVCATSGVVGLGLLGGLAALGAATMEPGLLAMLGSLPVVGAGIWGIGWTQARRWLPRRRADFAALGGEVLREVQGSGRRIPPAAP